jgi:hypothetical protein
MFDHKMLEIICGNNIIGDEIYGQGGFDNVRSTSDSIPADVLFPGEHRLCECRGFFPTTKYVDSYRMHHICWFVAELCR